MKNFFKKCKTEKGLYLIEYGIMVGLMCSVAIGGTLWLSGAQENSRVEKENTTPITYSATKYELQSNSPLNPTKN